MTLKNFEDFVRIGKVKKQTQNTERALALIAEAEGKKNFLEVSLKSIPPEQMNANFIVESCYDILLELVRSKMFIDGYNSSNSHEAEVSYLRILEFPEPDVRFMDELRYYRNGIKYYGKILGMDYAKTVLDFMDKNYPKLRKFLK